MKKDILLNTGEIKNLKKAKKRQLCMGDKLGCVDAK